MTITASMVKELRESTGAGMMDAKKALTETGGNMDEAVDWLRTKGLAKAAKKSGRTAAEGLVAVHVEGGKGIAVEVNSETDFVGKNAEFQAMVGSIATAALGVSGEILPEVLLHFEERVRELASMFEVTLPQDMSHARMLDLARTALVTVSMETVADLAQMTAEDSELECATGNPSASRRPKS